MENVYEIIAKNLKELRNIHKLTQGEVADEIGVSDKTISKWELGGSTPSIEYLIKLSDLYGVSLDQITKETTFEIVENEDDIVDKKQLKQQIIVLSMVPVVFLFVAICVFVGNMIIHSDNSGINMWIAFIWMIPASCLSMGILVKRWWKKCRTLHILTSTFIWSSLLSFYLQFQFYPPYKSFWFIFLIGIPIQIAIVLLSRI